MRAAAMSVWVFINLLFFGMCGYLYLIWSQYWMYIEKQRLFNNAPATPQRSSFISGLNLEAKYNFNASTLKVDSVQKRSAIGLFWSSGKIVQSLDKTLDPQHPSSNIVRKNHGSPRFPNIHKPLLEFDSEKYLCDPDDLYSSECVSRTEQFKDLLLKEFHRVLMGESKVFRSGLDSHNTYDVKYDGDLGQDMSHLELMCSLKKVEVRTVAPEDEPFKSLGFRIPKEPIQAHKVFNTCAVVTSAGALLDSRLGQFIDLWLLQLGNSANMWSAVRNQFKQTWLTTLMSMILFSGVTYFLVWAESQTIQSNLMLEELVNAAQSIDVHIEDDAARYEGRVLHIIGPLRILEPISEPDYNIHVQAVKLRKRVQMYQWIEESTEQESFLSEPAEESRKTYWYHKDWRDYVVDSNLFYIRSDHHNPTSMPMFSETHIAENVKIGWLYLGLDVKRKVNDYYEIWSDSRPERTDIKLHSGFYYHGESALHHQIGDLRIHFSYAGREDDIYTAVGIVESGALQAYSPANFPQADPISLLRKGSFSLKQLHDLERRDANIHTWKYRLLGFVQVFASAMTLHPDWVTIFLQQQWISSNLRRCSRLWVNLVLTFSYTLLIISIPWLIHKPAFGAVVLGGAALPLLHYSTVLARRDPTPTPPPRGSYTRWNDSIR